MAEINMLVPAQLTKYDDLSDDEDPDMFDAILGTKRGHRNLKSSGSSRKKVKQEPEDSGFVFKSEPIEKKVPRTRAASKATTNQPVRTSTRPLTVRLKSPITFTKEFYAGPFGSPASKEQFHGSRDLCIQSTDEMRTHFLLSHGDAQYLARRLDNIEFQFAPDAELDSTRAELDRGHWFKAVLQKLTSNYSFDVPELIKYTTPDLFIATVKEQGTILGHLICQPKPTTPFAEISRPTSLILDAISHYSFIEGKEERVLEDFKAATGLDGSISLFAPISHSVGADSGLYDDGPDGLELFKTSHLCNDICAKLGLSAL
ncbi:hypothetical protein B0H10DRAFT_2211607 [Mycena sp. CBHHK59/15]|nr:hypothetical protein B0H10DRAFT_2211607 [Mycena sp. CBHHK59/15]